MVIHDKDDTLLSGYINVGDTYQIVVYLTEETGIASAF